MHKLLKNTYFLYLIIKMNDIFIFYLHMYILKTQLSRFLNKKIIKIIFNLHIYENVRFYFLSLVENATRETSSITTNLKFKTIK